MSLLQSILEPIEVQIKINNRKQKIEEVQLADITIIYSTYDYKTSIELKKNKEILNLFLERQFFPREKRAKLAKQVVFYSMMIPNFRYNIGEKIFKESARIVINEHCAFLEKIVSYSLKKNMKGWRLEVLQEIIDLEEGVNSLFLLKKAIKNIAKYGSLFMEEPEINRILEKKFGIKGQYIVS